MKMHAAAMGNRFTPIRPHDCKHTYATALYDANVDLRTAQYFLGHLDIHTTLQICSSDKAENEKEVGSIVSFLNTLVKEIPPKEDK